MVLASNACVFVAVWGGLASLGILPMPPEWAGPLVVAVLGCIAGYVLGMGDDDAV
jgi:hypothetical protein